MTIEREMLVRALEHMIGSLTTVKVAVECELVNPRNGIKVMREIIVPTIDELDRIMALINEEGG